MADNTVTLYTRLVTVAYSYYILLSLAWLVMSFIYGPYFNFYAFIAAAMFGVQLYHKNRLVNLLFGIVLIFLSIYFLLEFLAMGGKSGFNAFTNIMSGLSFISIIMSGILVFSYLKLSFADR